MQFLYPLSQLITYFLFAILTYSHRKRDAGRFLPAALALAFGFGFVSFGFRLSLDICT